MECGEQRSSLPCACPPLLNHPRRSLDRMRADAEAVGVHTIRIEAPENRSLPGVLAPQLRLALLRLSHLDAAKEMAQRGLRALADFVASLKIKYQDIEVGLDLAPEPGLADNGDLEGDFGALLQQVGQAALNGNTALVMFIDELQYLQEDQFGALISALHRCAQNKLPITVVGAGLPQLSSAKKLNSPFSSRFETRVRISPQRRS